MEVVARRGFDATVDEIAQVSGVSPRTIFRHYASHDQLIVATVKDMCEACGRKPIEGLPSPTDDLDGWIEGVALTIHTRNAEIFGEAFWDIHAPAATLLRCSRRWTLCGTIPEPEGFSSWPAWPGRRPVALVGLRRIWCWPSPSTSQRSPPRRS